MITVFNVQSNWASAKVREVGAMIKYLLGDWGNLTLAEGRDEIMVFKVQSNWAGAKLYEVGGAIQQHFRRLGQLDAGRGKGNDYGFHV